MASLYIVGTGPGAPLHLTDAAKLAIQDSDIIVGYDNYVELVRPLLAGKQIVSTGMMQEVQRCREAIRLARTGSSVAIVSGGDSGIYGMAGLLLELIELDLRQDPAATHLDVKIVPGISAVQAAAALLGAPLMHDFAVISLSDLLTPWELIKCRLDAAARADFVISLYNPRSKSRQTQIQEAQKIILKYRLPETPAGIVRNAYRDGQNVVVTTLGQLLDHEIDMSTVVLIGNASTFIDAEGRIVTPRGYTGKYGSGILEKEKIAEQPPLSHSGAVMFCGTASDVGKSVVTAGFCRYLVKHGMAVAPFKSQNMSLNSYVTHEGGEIGRAQAVQAQACDINPHTDMNPILLKPNSDTGSQIVVQGRPVGTMSIAEYDVYKTTAYEKIWESFDRLHQAYEFIVIEGAGSIAEINLKKNDIANLKIAEMARCPVILVADIDRGGVFAQIVGTVELLDPLERSYIKGVIINKFRGDIEILKPGIEFIEQRIGIPVLGVLPWFSDINLPAEDSVALGQRSKVVSIIAGIKKINIGVIKLPRISNFTDFDPLEKEPDVHLSYVEVPEQIQGLDILIIPGSKSTIADLYFLMERGLYNSIQDFKGHIVGICGGFQMLGTVVFDPDGVESSIKEAQALDLLPSTTVLLREKETHQVLTYLDEAGLTVAPDCNGVMTGYEIHMGETTLGKGVQPFSRIFRRGNTSVSIEDGAVSNDGRIFGTYLHGVFENSRFREIYLNRIRLEKGMPLRRGGEKQSLRDPFDQLSEQLEKYLDMPRIMAICGLGIDTP
ncbi:MAG: cobyric acid synthase [Desulfuromonadaceae bacterium]|nr:cobyric acid synthase [Desulfuromonadaceae bacterium]MDD2856199.1 cobyric acid synthase [Desulfuromonadaceae bacterium]